MSYITNGVACSVNEVKKVSDCANLEDLVHMKQR